MIGNPLSSALGKICQLPCVWVCLLTSACAETNADANMKTEMDESDSSETVFCGSVATPLQPDEVFTTFWNNSERHPFTFLEAQAALQGTYDCEID